MQVPLITVLMPLYNAAAFVAEATASILNQSFTAFELLVVDDGSTDDSLKIIASFNDPRIQIVRNPQNLGITASLNKGIAMARAPLIARMDADDISHPLRLEKQYAFFESNPDVALLGSWVEEFSANKEERTPVAFAVNEYYYQLHFSCWLYHSSVMFRKDAVTAVGGYKQPYAEDFDLWWRLIQQYRFAVLPEYLLLYRHSAQSLHKVVAKEAYAAAERAAVQRNIGHYLPQEQLSSAQLASLSGHHQELLQMQHVKACTQLLVVLKKLAEEIARKPNANCVPAEVLQAGVRHRQQLLQSYLRGLPFIKSLQLAVQTNAWRTYLSIVKNYLTRRL